MVLVAPRQCFLTDEHLLRRASRTRMVFQFDMYLIEGAGMDLEGSRTSIFGLHYLRRGSLPALRRRYVAAAEAYSTEVSAAPDELARWTAVQQATFASLREAATQLLYGHGRLEDGSPAPGWRAFVRYSSLRASRRAFTEFLERVRRIEEAYRPVRDEIQNRVLEARRKAEERARERRRRIAAVAARVRWSYQVDEAAEVVHIHSADGAGLDSQALRKELREVRRTTGLFRLRWDDDARAEVERASGVDFRTWWHSISPYPWSHVGESAIPDTPVKRGPSIGGSDTGVGYTGSGGVSVPSA